VGGDRGVKLTNHLSLLPRLRKNDSRCFTSPIPLHVRMTWNMVVHSDMGDRMIQRRLRLSEAKVHIPSNTT
jgi:hypothetical protein